MTTESTPSTDIKVLDFASFKQKKSIEQEVSRGRDPLYVNPATGKVSASAQGTVDAFGNDKDFSDRVQKIRSSLDRINGLMADLKKLSAQRENEKI